jgi:hypothetical protein
MWPFKRSAASRWARVTKDCDFNLAKREIATFFEILKSDAARNGGQYFIEPEFANAWRSFSDQPNAETAANLLEIAPMLTRYFEGCRPGGNFYNYEMFKQ